MPTTPELSAGQEVLRTVSLALLLLGGVTTASGLGVLRRRRGRGTDKPSNRRLALGIAMLVGGLIATAFHHDPGPEPEVITKEHFSSTRLPAVAVDAKPPWLLVHDAAAGRVFATCPAGKLMIETTFITDANDSVTVLKNLFDEYAKIGLAPSGEPFAQWFDGVQASGRTGIAGVGSSTIWVVERLGKLFMVIVCTSEKAHDAQTACDGVLGSLKWRAPGPS